MVESVNCLNAVSDREGMTTGRRRESDYEKNGSRDDLITHLETRCINVSFDNQKAKPFDCSKIPLNEPNQDCAFLTLCRLVARILQDQHTASQLDDGEFEAIVIDRITPENAKTLVANDGHWQPDRTAARIVSFALTIWGGDLKKLDGIKESITSGFELAGEEFGGELPEISRRTFTAVMDSLEEWSINPGAKRSK